MIEQRADATFRRRQIAGPQRDRARRQGKCGTQRCYVIGRASVLDAVFGDARRLIWKPLQPQYPCKEGACRHPRIELKAIDLGLPGRRNIVSEHVLEVAPRAGLIAQKMFQDTDQSVADQPIVRVGPVRRQATEPSCQCQSEAMLAATHMKGPKAPERP